MKQLSGLHVVTDAEMCPGRTHEDIARAAANAGAPVVQLRDKSLSDGEFYRIALNIREITRQAGLIFIVNDRVDIAIAVEADGVHVGQSDMPAAVVRRLIGRDRVLGISATSIEEALRAAEDGADYIGFGPIFSTATKADAAPPTGLTQLQDLKSRLGTPIVAIGGIGLKNISEVAAAGADAAAVVSAIVCADDMTTAIAELTTGFARATG